MSEASRTRDKCKGSVYPAARRIGDRTCASFTDDDEGKRVVNANGEEIGIVQNISGGTAHVDLSPGITDTIKSKLGWGDDDAETYPLEADRVESITDDEIRIQQL